MMRYLIPLVLVVLTGCGWGKLERALIEAASNGDIVQMSRLIDRGANVNGVALDGWTPLTAAAAAGRLEAVKLLLMRGAEIDRTASTVTPLQWAAFDGHLDVARFLVESGGKLRLDPVLKARFLDKVKSFKSDELLSLVLNAMSHEDVGVSGQPEFPAKR